VSLKKNNYTEAPNGVKTGDVSVLAGVEVTSTTTQSISALTIQAAIAHGATDVPQPAQEILPPKSDVISLKDITVEESRGFTDGQLIEECKKRARFAYASQQQLNSDAGNLDIVYQEMVARFRNQNLKGDNRGDKPTLKQAFDRADWKYDAARKFHQRYQAWLKKHLLTDDESPEKLYLTDD
jgi:hypothetical protein